MEEKTQIRDSYIHKLGKSFYMEIAETLKSSASFISPRPPQDIDPYQRGILYTSLCPG